MNVGAAFDSPATGTLLSIPGGNAGVRTTLAMMVQLARTYKADLNIRTLAVELVQPCPPRDRRAELSTLQTFVRDQIRYVGDIDNIETLQTPIQTLKLSAGDCDDKATLLSSLAGAIGFPTRFCAIGVKGEPFSHVMAQAMLGAGWVNCETIIPGAEVGWFPPDATSVMLAHV